MISSQPAPGTARTDSHRCNNFHMLPQTMAATFFPPVLHGSPYKNNTAQQKQELPKYFR